MNSLSQINFFEIGLRVRQEAFYKSFMGMAGGLLYFIGNDSDIRISKSRCLNSYRIFQGSHKSKDYLEYDLELPTSIVFEKNSSYINLEGKVILTKKVISTQIRLLQDGEIFKILLALKSKLILSNFSIFKNFFFCISYFKFLISYYSLLNLMTFYRSGSQIKDIGLNYFKNLVSCSNVGSNKFHNSVLTSSILNYYTSSLIARSSKNIQLASIEYAQGIKNFNIAPITII